MSVSTEVRVRYAETDQMGIVYYANYLVWFELGRVECLRALGLAYSVLEKDHGCILPVIESHCRYRSPARYDDEIVVKTWLKNIRESVIHFGYELLRVEDGSLLAEGETTHIVADAQMRKAVLPEKYMSVFREAVGR